MSEFVADRDALAEVLAAHHGMGIVPTRCNCEQWELPKFSKPAGPQYARHVLDAILASGVVQDAADVRRAVAAETLREAAEALGEDWIRRGTHPGLAGCYSPGYEHWLLRRADRIAAVRTTEATP